MKTWLPLIVALLGLGFAVLSFWWLHWRTGRLTASEPTFYAKGFGNGKMHLLWPLVLTNTGPRSLALLDARLTIDDERRLMWGRTRDGVSPSHSQLVDLAAPIAVPGGDTVVLYTEFDDDDDSPLGQGDYALLAEVRTSKRPEWHALGEFTLRIDAAAASVRNHIAFTNRPA